MEGVIKESSPRDQWQRKPNYIEPMFRIEANRLSESLQACTSERNLRRGLAHHSHMIKLVSISCISLWNKLINMYSQCGHLDYASRVFENMLERDTISFNTIISAYLNHRFHNRVFSMYSMMKEAGLTPNSITLTLLFKACNSLSSVNPLTQIHVEALKRGLNSDGFVGSSLIDGYSKLREIGEARQAFADISKVDLVSWNVMINAYIENSCDEEAIETFSQMRREGLKPDGFTLTSILGAFSEGHEVGDQLHGCLIKEGLAFKTPVVNALLTMYSKSKKMGSSSKLFARMQAPNLISWTAMISGFAQNDLNHEAVRFYQGMQREGMRENQFTLASVLPAYGGLATLQQSQQVHARILKLGFVSDVLVANALIDSYSKCGSLLEAHLLFQTLNYRDVVSFTVMIGAFSQHGKSKEALSLFKRMEREGMRPDEITFLGLLSACSHGGLVKEGLMVFKTMTDFYGIKPRTEHHSCVVDMLGRAGRLREAESFIKIMSIEKEGAAWEAFLGACMIHGEIELGAMAAEKVMEIEPEREGAYILLSNIYAAKGKWEDKGKIRKRLNESGLRKATGCSWIEVKGEFKEFVAGALSNQCSNDIYNLMRNLNNEMSMAGFVPSIEKSA
ncbi:hypothetical protein AMTRI_Chr03g138300 [Amborella trichopoda]